MGEMLLIEGALKRAARRRRLVTAWRGFWKGLLLGVTIWLLTFAAFKLYPIPPIALTVAPWVAVAIVLAFTLAGALKRVTLLETARWVDNQQRLKERLSTALELSKSNGESEWKELVVRDAADHAQQVEPRKLLPFSWPTAAKWAVLLLVLGVGLGFVPEYRSKAYKQKQKDAAVMRDVGKNLADFAKRTVEQKKPLLEPTQKADRKS